MTEAEFFGGAPVTQYTFAGFSTRDHDTIRDARRKWTKVYGDRASIAILPSERLTVYAILRLHLGAPESWTHGHRAHLGGFAWKTHGLRFDALQSAVIADPYNANRARRNAALESVWACIEPGVPYHAGTP